MQAIRKVVGDPLGEELYGLWKEYEDLETVEAIYCKERTKIHLDEPPQRNQGPTLVWSADTSPSLLGISRTTCELQANG